MSIKASLFVLKDRDFGWFFASRFVNLAGSSMSHVALAFAVLEVSDSASALGYVVAAHTIPMVVFLLIGGVIADRFPRRLVLQLSNVASALTQAAAATLIISGHAEIWQLVVLEAMNGTAMAMAFPAMQGMVPQLVAKKDLQPANLLLSMSRSTLTILGPSIAALLVVGVGAGWALAVDALTWLLAALFLLRVRIPPRPADAEKTSALQDLRAGWTYFRSTTWLWVVVVAFAILNAIQSGGQQVLGPAYAKSSSIGVEGWGLGNSALAAGMLVMTIVLMRATIRRPLRAGMCGIMVFGLPFFALALWPQTVPFVVTMAVAGAGIEIFSLGWSLAMQENVPEEMLSRAYSYDALGSFVAMPVGQLLYGPLGAWFGARPVFLASGMLYVVVCLAVLSVPSVVRLQRVEQPATEGTPA
ncbi:putative MFS family arabinose efflux permease [Nocardioides albertanoniae]|uniref:Putative MFS family arabinose efflux permease n=1 Tax=Nocardioides albertanoniae TaxID=1175486 RepID=A0A543A585_9ACTN|nr:MFS transporter [Nocardioides albertanoniae]TQL67714.1 putative MFS family arabinose efflux permease [Nocardioides albertanoniae]